MNYINIHKHSPCISNEICIQDLIIGKDKIQILPNKHYSVGIHPWFINNIEQQKQDLVEVSHKKNVIAIGETGLDFQKNILLHTPVALQLDLFKFQIELAYKRQKPLIIHCVKCFDELIKLKKQYKDSIPWIIHGFSKNSNIANQLIKNDFYLSFGHHLLQSEKNKEALIGVPKEKIFFETDDKNLPIEKIYEEAAFLLKTSIKILKNQIAENYKSIFYI